MLQSNILVGDERTPTFRQEQWHDADTGPCMMGFGELSGEGDDHFSNKGSLYGEEENGDIYWSPQKIVHCAQSIEVTVEGTTDGWDPLVKFVQSRESQNRLERKGSKSTRKGARELNNLNCSINYDKTNSKETKKHIV